MSRTLAILVAAGSMLLTAATASPALADHGGGGGGGGGQPPGTALQSELYGASCTSALACTAVGDYVTSTGASKTLAERWNGTAWTLQSTPNPSGASYLNGVSCPSASACTAVGWYVTSTNATLTLAENWNGTTWAAQSTPNPIGAAHSFLQDVSCTSASACTAVGDYTTSAGVDQALAENWNGTTWTLQSTPTPSGASSSGLSGVSCTSASACTATGYYTSSAGVGQTLAETWNGTTWTLQSTPTPNGAASSALSGVSCTSASACIATGYYTTSAGVYQTLAENWNGTTWTLQSTPTPNGATSSGLSGVSCTSASACTSVGWYEASPGVYETLAETWNGTTWAIQSTPNRTGATSSYLFGVSCTSASACTATGYDLSPSYKALAERWNGTAWALQSTPNP